MSCCSQQSGSRLVVSQKDIDEGLRLEIEYWGGRPIEVLGPVTGQKYVFSGLSRVGLIDPRDAPGVLRSQTFRMRGVKKIGGKG